MGGEEDGHDGDVAPLRAGGVEEGPLRDIGGVLDRDVGHLQR